jgi:hypothetical protein
MNTLRLISHRGNLNGLNHDRENTPSFIDEAIDLGYDVEVDIRLVDSVLHLGHDGPENIITLEWLHKRRSNLWIHCKNFEALSFLLNYDLVIFFHEQESYTIINNGKIWAHDLSLVDNKCIIPLLSKEKIINWKSQPVYGVCSDYISLLKND